MQEHEFFFNHLPTLSLGPFNVPVYFFGTHSGEIVPVNRYFGFLWSVVILFYLEPCLETLCTVLHAVHE